LHLSEARCDVRGLWIRFERLRKERGTSLRVTFLLGQVGGFAKKPGTGLEVGGDSRERLRRVDGGTSISQLSRRLGKYYGGRQGGAVDGERRAALDGGVPVSAAAKVKARELEPVHEAFCLVHARLQSSPARFERQANRPIITRTYAGPSARSQRV